MRYFVVAIFLSWVTMMTAQEGWSVTIRPSIHIPTKEVLGDPLRLGNGLDVTALRMLNQKVGIYGGLIWNRFDRDEDFLEDDIEYIQRGFTLGGLYSFKVLKKIENPFYLRAGLQIMDARTNSPNPSLNINAEWSVGAQLGLGMKIKSLGRLHIVPEVRYNTISNNDSFNGNERSLTFSSIAITVGISYSFN